MEEGLLECPEPRTTDNLNWFREAVVTTVCSVLSELFADRHLGRLRRDRACSPPECSSGDSREFE
jgi:hypothetical protein